MKTKTRCASRRTTGGFTLIELMAATAITGILAATAYPSFQAPLLKARRSDGIVSLLQLQMQQERWRSEHASYASMDELRQATKSASGYYTLDIGRHSPTSYELTATANGAQAKDGTCKVLRLSVTEGSTLYGAGTDGDNPPADGKRCWNL